MTGHSESDRKNVPSKEGYEVLPGGIKVGAGGPQPLWLKLLTPLLYLFAITYLLVYAGDKAIIRIFGAALAIRAGFIVYRSFVKSL